MKSFEQQVSVEIDHTSGSDTKAKQLGISLKKTVGSEYAYIASGSRENLKQYLIYQYDSEEDAKDIHPEIFEV